MTKKRRRRLTCRDYMRTPLCQAVLDHIKACPSCRALVNELANDLDFRAYGFEHRN
jgi:predicted anti-sigma-YlaC factor YlaD